MLYEINVMDALNLQIAEDDGYTLKRVNRRKLDDNKAHYEGNSCFRKGYHKYERDWKKAERRNRRHADKAELRRQPKVSAEALKDWAMAQVFHDGYFRREAFGAEVTPYYTNLGRRGKYNRSIDSYDYTKLERLRKYNRSIVGYEIWVGIDEYDVDEDLAEYGEVFFVSVNEAINLGLVE